MYKKKTPLGALSASSNEFITTQPLPTDIVKSPSPAVMVSARLLGQLIFAGAAMAGTLELRQEQCTSDDACKSVCAAPKVVAQGVNVTPNEAIQAEARRRFGDFHCVKGTCSCAVSIHKA